MGVVIPHTEVVECDRGVILLAGKLARVVAGACLGGIQERTGVLRTGNDKD